MDTAAARRPVRTRARAWHLQLHLLMLGAAALLLLLVTVVALVPAERTLDVLAGIAGALSALGLLWLARRRRRAP